MAKKKRKPPKAAKAKIKKPVKFLKLEVHKVKSDDRHFPQGMSPIKQARELISSSRRQALRRLDELATHLRDLDQQERMIERLDQLRVDDGAWVTPDRELLLDMNWYIVRETQYVEKLGKTVMYGPIRLARWRDAGGWEDQGMAPTHAGLVMYIPNPKVRIDELPGEEA